MPCSRAMPAMPAASSSFAAASGGVLSPLMRRRMRGYICRKLNTQVRVAPSSSPHARSNARRCQRTSLSSANTIGS